MKSRGWIEPVILILAAGGALAFSNGEHANALAAWVAPVLLVRLFRRQPFARGLALAYLAALPAWLFEWSGVFRLHGPELWVTAGVLAAVGLAPYAADRLLARRLGQWGVLVLPCALVGLEFGFTLLSPYGSWGSLAYSQVELPPLAQIASVVGMWGLTFLIGLAASTANLVWEAPAQSRRWAGAVTVLALVLAASLGFGFNRLRTTASGPTLKTASVAAQYDNNRNYDTGLAPAIQAHLFAESERQAQAGARLIVWPEDSFFILPMDEPALIARGQALARRFGVHLGMSYGLRLDAGTKRYRNTTLMIDPQGRSAWRYHKAYPVPGYEGKYMLPGRQAGLLSPTPWGRLGAAICFDGDHHEVISRFGAAGAVLALLPSDDWPAVSVLHARMTQMRAIEQGVPILRPTMNGRSLALDGYGRILAALEPDAPSPKVMTADMPLGARPALYARIGDAFAWVCLGLLALLTFAGLLRRSAKPGS
jgi:apolipoprotein N-acyltransferase